jgi:streptomycin 6-kinase
MRHLQRLRVPAALVLALLLVDCGGRLAAPVQLSPIGDTAFYARRAIQAVDALQAMAIDAEAANVLPTAEARLIIDATKVAGEAGVELSNALKAGSKGTTDRDKAVRTIRAAIQGAFERLSPASQQVAGPYVTTVLTLLTVFTA